MPFGALFGFALVVLFTLFVSLTASRSMLSTLELDVGHVSNALLYKFSGVGVCA